MIVKTVIEENFNHYKKPSMLICFPSCTFKCDIECGEQVCQNSTLAKSPNIECNIQHIINKYMSNHLTTAIVLAGLEPMDSYENVLQIINEFRQVVNDDIVIYTGYNKSEIQDKLELIKQYKNIIIKFGRFIPGQEKHYDDLLGVYLASNNQYAERVS